MISIIKNAAFFALFLVGMTSCNKEDLNAKKAMKVVIRGYNGTAGELQIDIDTTQYDKTVAYGKYIVQPGTIVNFDPVYVYSDNGQQRMVKIKDAGTGKMLFSKPLPATGTTAFYPFIYLDGKEQEIPVPDASASTNKLGFYVHSAETTEPFDIFLYKMDYNTGMEYHHYLAQNVNAGTWVFTDYIAAEGFNSENDLRNSSIRFTKTGTNNEWAFNDNESESSFPAFGMVLPVTGELGLVKPYFIARGAYQLENVKLFFDKDRE